jgi:recombination protein RecT
VVKRAQKYWPKTERLEAAVHHMDTDGGEGIVIEAPQVALTSEQVDDLLAKINDYTDADALRGYWPELSKFMRESASGSQYEFIKQKFVEKGKSLEQVPA